MNKKIALAGNPNVGKSTVFNALTGLKQHTGNWAGKTVENAMGKLTYQNQDYQIYDLPGTYSLISHSLEEEIAKNFICFEQPDVIVVVCDAVCLERNLNLVLQILEISKKVIICVNLLDEAKKKNIYVDLKKLSQILNVEVVGTSARSKQGLDELVKKIAFFKNKSTYEIKYPPLIEESISKLIPFIECENLNPRWVALKIIENDEKTINLIEKYLNKNLITPNIESKVNDIKNNLLENDILTNEINDIVVTNIVNEANKIANKVVTFKDQNYNSKDHKIDKILTSKWLGIPIMLMLLMVIFWLTIKGANKPSEILFNFLFYISDKLEIFLNFIHLPYIFIDVIINGVYKVLAWVVSVMLPPMAIFFPLFTILEDLGYLPRIAFNLDKYFHKCLSCGKQALTMCMGFGCNAVGVTGARIIDSKRERLLAIITNSLVPCNGRFPTLIAIISMFLVVGSSSLLSSLILTLVILFSILMTLLVTKILSHTILKGQPSSFTLELPPYRRPQIIKVIIRSIFERSIFVLGRAVMIAMPAGLIIWLLANIGTPSILSICTNFLDPFAHIFGMDGVILMAFILGFPANEIVIPLMIMGYMSLGSITDITDLTVLKNLFLANNWTIITALCVMTFSLIHWPCSTTCLTIKKETKSLKWTMVSILIPTIIGFICCFLINMIGHIFM